MKAVIGQANARAIVVRHQSKCVNLEWFMNQILYIWHKTFWHHSMFTTFLNICSLQQAIFFFLRMVRGWNAYISKPKWSTGSWLTNNSLSSYNIYFKLLGIAYKANHNLSLTYHFNHISLLYWKSTLLHIPFIPSILNISSDNKQPRI